MATRPIGYDPDQIPLNSFLSDSAFIAAPNLPLSDAAIAANNITNASLIAHGASLTNLDASSHPPFMPTISAIFALSRRLDSKFSMSRNSVATYMNATGKLAQADANRPVFEWDGNNGKCRGLRVEPSRTNLFNYSEQFDNAAWTKINLTVSANTGIAPDGTMTDDKLIPTTAAALHSVSQSRTVATGFVSFSTYAKRAEYSRVRLQVGGVAAARVDFDLVAGTFSNVTIDSGFTGSITPYMVALTNGGYRIGFSGNVTAGGTMTSIIYVGAGVTGDFFVSPGDGTSGVYQWGAQLEAGSSPSSYIPTTTTAVTRPADIITLPLVAAAEVLNPAQGAFVVEFTLNASPVGGELWDIFEYSNGTDSERMFLRVSSSSIQIVMYSGGVVVLLQTALASSPSVGVRQRVAFLFSTSAVRSSVNGAPVVSTAPTVAVAALWDRLSVGSARGNRVMNGHIAHLSTFARTLTDNELRTISAL